MKILQKILWGIIIFNVVAVVAFWLPPGRAYYMPEFLMGITGFLTSYVILKFVPVCILGTIATLGLVIFKKVKKYPIEKNNIVMLIMYILSIPWGWFMFNAAMSV